MFESAVHALRHEAPILMRRSIIVKVASFESQLR